MLTVLDALFDEICFGFSLSRFFDSHDAPSFFVIYTHENPALGKADSRMVRKMISHLEKISSKCRSDRRPTLNSDPSKSRARNDILENQFCLLPKDVSETSVDKVLLFYSEALQNYCTMAEGRKYIEALKTVGLQGFKELQHNLRDESIVASATAQSVKASIRALVETHTRESWFHHILTERGLVSLRTAWNSNPYTVVAIDLHGTGTISDTLDFFGRTQHYVRPPPLGSVVIDQIERYHRLFFALLERIYEDRPIIVELVQQHYQKGLTYLEESPLESLAVFKMTVRFEITEDIRRVGAYVPRRKPISQYLDRARQELDASAERARIIDGHERMNLELSRGVVERDERKRFKDADERCKSYITTSICHGLLFDEFYSHTGAPIQWVREG